MGLPPGPRTPAVLNALMFARRPLGVLAEWHARYGDVFTVSIAGFGTGVYVADPDAIRELFTGDQSDLRAGEANSFMEPVLGPHSVLILDGPEHLRQRKLLLPPFQGVAGGRVPRGHPRGGRARARGLASRRAARAARAHACAHLRGDLPRGVRRDPAGAGGAPARGARAR